VSEDFSGTATEKPHLLLPPRGCGPSDRHNLLQFPDLSCKLSLQAAEEQTSLEMLGGLARRRERSAAKHTNLNATWSSQWWQAHDVSALRLAVRPFDVRLRRAARHLEQ